LPESVANTDPLVGALAKPKTLVRRTASKDTAELELTVKTAIDTTMLDDITVPRETLQTMQLSASHWEFSHADMPVLAFPDMPAIPKPTVAIINDDDPVDATLAVPITSVFIGDENENT